MTVLNIINMMGSSNVPTFKGAFTLIDNQTTTDKNLLYRIVWRCSYCIDTLTPLGTVAILSISFSVSVNELLDNRQRMDLQDDDENTTV